MTTAVFDQASLAALTDARRKPSPFSCGAALVLRNMLHLSIHFVKLSVCHCRCKASRNDSGIGGERLHPEKVKRPPSFRYTFRGSVVLYYQSYLLRAKQINIWLLTSSHGQPS